MKMTSDELQRLVNQQLVAFKDGEVSYPTVLLAQLKERVELDTREDRYNRHFYPQ